MPILSEQDLTKMADRVVDKFLLRNAQLDEAAAHEAQNGSLNADQIERLVEFANTQAFLRTMDQRKQEGAGDLMHEFDPIDAKRVIKIVIDGNGVSAEECTPNQGMSSPNEGPIQNDVVPDEMSAIRNPGAKQEPSADQAEPDDVEEIDEKDTPNKKKKEKKASFSVKERENAIFKLRKVASSISNRRLELNYVFNDAIVNLANRFKLAHGPSFNDFERDLLSEDFSKEAGVILNAVRAELRLPEVAESALTEKRSALRNHFADETKELGLFSNLIKIVKEAQKLDAGLALLRERCPQCM